MVIVIEKKNIIRSIVGIVIFAAVVITVYLMIPKTIRVYQNAKVFMRIENRAAERAEEYITELENLRISQLKDAQVGDSIYFGFYEQDNDLMNGKEEIEWDVLAREGDKILVISKYMLDAKPYHETREAVKWENCTLRVWLNEEFMNEAFSYTLQKRIETVTLSHREYVKHVMIEVAENTKDQIFLLSEQEAVEYYEANRRERAEIRRSSATAYAIARGVVVDADRICVREYVLFKAGEERMEPEYGQSIWWLRASGDGVKAVAHTGRIIGDDIEVDTEEFGVRPAMWLNTAS